MTDAQLMARIQAGQLHLLAVLYKRHYLKLFRVLISQTRNLPMSEDVVQDTFLAILEGCHTYNTSLPFDSWMYGIAYNKVKEHLHGTTQPHCEMPELPDPSPGPHEQHQKAEHLRYMARALKAMTPKERVLLELCKNKKYKDIAPIIGCDPGTVKHRVNRALKKLRSKYDALQRRGV